MRNRSLALALVLTAIALARPQAQVSIAFRPGETPRPQLVVMVFDLTTELVSGFTAKLAREHRERIVAAAQQTIGVDRARFILGLDASRVYRVVTLGTSAEVVQDFTADQNKITSALSKVASAPPSTADRPMRVAAMQRLCEDVSRLPPSDSYFADAAELLARRMIGAARPVVMDSTRRAVDHYLGSGTSLSEADHRSIEHTCGLPNLSYALAPQTASLGVASSPLVALVFDTAALSGDDLHRARDRATSIVDNLSGTEAAAVVTTGVVPTFAQDFTRDKVQLRAALANLKLPQTAPDANTTATSVRSLCGSMTRNAQPAAYYFERGMVGLMTQIAPSGQVVLSVGSPRLFYFSTAIEQGALAARDLFDVAATCTTTNNTSFYVFDSPWIAPVYSPPTNSPAGMRQIGLDVGVGLSFAARQRNCPVALTSKQQALDNGYISAIVRNESPKLVERVTLGAVVTPNHHLPSVPRVLMTPGPTTSLMPGHSFEMSTRLADPEVLALLSRQGARVEVGVVDVQFGDGTKWTYDLKANGKFERQ